MYSQHLYPPGYVASGLLRVLGGEKEKNGGAAHVYADPGPGISRGDEA